MQHPQIQFIFYGVKPQTATQQAFVFDTAPQRYLDTELLIVVVHGEPRKASEAVRCV